MLLVPVSRHVSPFARSLNRLFDDSFERAFGPDDGPRQPALDVTETEAGYGVTLDLPGVAKEDVQVSIDGRRVTVQAETRHSAEKVEGERVLYRERSRASFARTFTLPQEIDQTESNARLENGVLTLQLNKRRVAGAGRLQIN